MAEILVTRRLMRLSFAAFLVSLTILFLREMDPKASASARSTGNKWQFISLYRRGQTRRRQMPVLILWAVPAVVVLGGAS
jgi:hypothetical protein